MSLNRRNALVMLGLVPATSAALAAEDYKLDPKLSHNGFNTSTEKIAVALERLAQAMRKEEVYVLSMHINTSIQPAELVSQTMKLEFCLRET